MSDLTELKRYVILHARGQQIERPERILDKITNDGEGSGSWTAEWSAEGERLLASGRPLEACRHFIMACFPYPDGPARHAARRALLGAFDQWREGRDLDRLEVEVKGARAVCWHTGPSVRQQPLLLLMGGIVSVKEQWASAFAAFRSMGMAPVAVDMPGVGENTMTYDADSWQLLPAVLDAVANRADVAHTYVMALSFSGHLAMRCAIDDARIKGVITVGAPVHEFFTGPWTGVPGLTVDTLAHLTGLPGTTLPEALRGWALTPATLRELRVPVAYVASRRDEIIPYGELTVLREHVADLRVLEHDDVHGAPDHLPQTQEWVVRSLLAMRPQPVTDRSSRG